MKQGDSPLDQDTLAAYISNTLPPEERAAVTKVLLRDPASRELLALAAQAVGAERDRLRDRLKVDSRDREAEKGSPRKSTRAARKSSSGHSESSTPD